MNESLSKWWELNLSEDEKLFFENLSRNPKYSWRSIDKLAAELGWPLNKLIGIAQTHVNNKMVLIKTDKSGTKSLAYWERVSSLKQLLEKPVKQANY